MQRVPVKIVIDSGLDPDLPLPLGISAAPTVTLKMSDAKPRARPEAAWKPAHNPWPIAVVVTLAAFMEILDTTIVNVALPHIAGSLSSSNDEATWALTSYLVANGIVLTISGWLGALFGRKRYFLICIAMFTVCSFLCGIAQQPASSSSSGWCRASSAAACSRTSSRSSSTLSAGKARRGVRRHRDRHHRRARAGADARRLITDTSNWRWIFFLNIPVGMIASFLVSILVEDPPWVKNRRSRGIDFIGLGFITLGLGCLQIMMDRGEDEDWFGFRLYPDDGALAFLGIIGASSGS